MRLVWTLAAFLLAVGIAAHCLDELHGRPLDTRLPASALAAAAGVSLAAAAAIGLWGMRSTGIYLLPFVLIGVVLVLGYNLELFGGALHTDHVFALGWGAFPVLVGGFAQTGSIELPVVLGAAFATATSLAQRYLSNWARRLRRGGLRVEGFVERPGEEREVLDVADADLAGGGLAARARGRARPARRGARRAAALLGLAPDLARRLDDEAQLRGLLLHAQVVAVDGRREPALRREAELVDVGEPRGLLDPSLELVLALELAALGGHETEHDELARRQEAQRLEAARALVVVLQEEAVDLRAR